MHQLIKTTTTLCALTLLIACSAESEKQRPAPAVSPGQSPGALKNTAKSSADYAHGKINQVLIIADEDLWKGMAGDTLFYYFTAPYILLPQPESIFDVVHMTPQQLTEQPVKKEFRTILFMADLNDQASVTSSILRQDLGPEKIEKARTGKGYNITVGQDKWARSQLLIYLSGFGPQKLVEAIQANFSGIAAKINEKDAETVRATAYQSGRNAELEAELTERFGVKMEIPGAFRKARISERKDMLWLRSDQREIIANILVTKVPYTSKAQLNREGIKQLRNEAGKLITTRQKDSYMRINDVDLPLFVENVKINNSYTVQARGIWDIVNDFMGGPFLSNLMLNQQTNELVLIDAFIYAPAKEKRNYMQEMELILSTARF
jgi:hypothetical protein